MGVFGKLSNNFPSSCSVVSLFSGFIAQSKQINALFLPYGLKSFLLPQYLHLPVFTSPIIAILFFTIISQYF